MFAKPVFQL
jgi:hypothetical protein